MHLKKNQAEDNKLQMSSNKRTINTIQREIKSAQLLDKIRNLLQTFLELRYLNLFEIGFRSWWCSWWWRKNMNISLTSMTDKTLYCQTCDAMKTYQVKKVGK